MATEEQIKVLLRAAISPLDKKMDHLTTEFAELKRSVENIHCSYGSVCLLVFVPYLLISLHP